MSLIPVNTFTAKTSPIRAVTFSLLIVCFCFIGFSALLVSQNVVNPLRNITNQFRSFQEGTLDLKTRLESKWNDEVGELVVWFNTFVESLEARQESEKRLSVSEERFRIAMEATADGLWDWDIESGQVYYSPGYYRMLGYEPGDFPENVSSWLDLIHPDDYSFAEGVHRACIENEIPSYEIEFRMKTKSDDWKWVMGSGKAASRDTNGKALRLIGTHADLTDRKKAQEIALASKKLASIGSLAAGMAHEINSPLQLVTGLSERLTRDLNADRFDKQQFLTDLDRINKNGWRIAKIIRSLLTYARKDYHEIAPQQLNDIIESTLLLIEHQLKSWSNISIEQALAPDLPLTHCDSNNITQVIINLLENARDAMPEGGWIKISTNYNAENKSVILQVSDTGTGITAENRTRIFDPFFTTKDIGKGTGLGLSIVHGIVEMHSGEIKMESPEGEGTTFTIHLPVESPNGSPQVETLGARS